MEDEKPKRDAGEVAPRSRDDSSDAKRDKDATPRQDAPDQNARTDGGRAIPAEDLNSANDE